MQLEAQVPLMYGSSKGSCEDTQELNTVGADGDSQIAAGDEKEDEP